MIYLGFGSYCFLYLTKICFENENYKYACICDWGKVMGGVREEKR